MAEEKNYHPRFIEYQEQIVNSPNYTGLPITRGSNGKLNWVAGKQTPIGKQRLEWGDKKAAELQITGDGKYAKLMFQIHPTRIKICQICGSEMSLYYIYLNSNLVKKINRTFGLSCNTNTSLIQAYPLMVEQKGEDFVKRFLMEEFDLSGEYVSSSGELIIDACEQACRIRKTSNKLGPGAMSNFPDRFDGFHSYNRCCRSSQDKGRDADNLKTYGKDRRAYEYWSDGNICSANGFMKSSFFNGFSADHTGPISLGFVHDSVYLKRMSKGDNSSKRDKLQYDDVMKIIQIERRTGIPAMNWFSQKIWNHLKDLVLSRSIISNGPELESVRRMLKQNMSNYMYILKQIRSVPGGDLFLIETFIKPKIQCFMYNYEWNEFGDVISREKRAINDANRKELERMERVCLQSVDDYETKSNRNVQPNLDSSELHQLSMICSNVAERNWINAELQLHELVELIEQRIILSG